MKLTKSQSHYLKAVYELSSGSSDGGVRVIDIAEKMSVSKASASLAVTKLSEQGFMYKDTERRAHLTAFGEREAVQLLDKFEIIKSFLVKILCVDQSVADQDACAIEHVASKDTLCAICRCLNKAKCLQACPLSVKPDL